MLWTGFTGRFWSNFEVRMVKFGRSLNQTRRPLSQTTDQTSRQLIKIPSHPMTKNEERPSAKREDAISNTERGHPAKSSLLGCKSMKVKLGFEPETPRGVFLPLEFIELSSREDDSSDAHSDRLPPRHVVTQVHSRFDHLYLRDRWCRRWGPLRVHRYSCQRDS